MCPVKVKESLLDHASVGRILSCGNTIYSQIILVISCKMHGFLAEPSCPVSASNAKQAVWRAYLKLALTNDLYAAETQGSTKIRLSSSSLCLVDTPDNFSVILCPARGDTGLYFTFPLGATVGQWKSGNEFRLEDGIKPWKEFQRQVCIEVTYNMEKAQASEIKNGPHFHWAIKKREREMHIFNCPGGQGGYLVTTGTLLGKEDEAPVWNKCEDECGDEMGKAERPRL